MLPGAAQNRELLSQVSDKDLDRAAAIVNSMTAGGAAQPEDPQRLAPGPDRRRAPGVTVGEVNNLVVRFLEGQKMMRQMMGGMPGMPGMPGMRRGGSKSRPRTRRRARAAACAGAAGQRPTAAARRASRSSPECRAAARPAPGIGQLPAGFGRGGPAGLPGGLGGLDGGSEGGFRLPPGLSTPQPNLPPGLRGPQPGRRNKKDR